MRHVEPQAMMAIPLKMDARPRVINMADKIGCPVKGEIKSRCIINPSNAVQTNVHARLTEDSGDTEIFASEGDSRGKRTERLSPRTLLGTVRRVYCV